MRLFVILLNLLILVCTTIIETGIDVPNANTIIINRAYKLCLAQFYQLRGRVVPSHHRAYSYLIIPNMNQEPLKTLSTLCTDVMRCDQFRFQISKG